MEIFFFFSLNLRAAVSKQQTPSRFLQSFFAFFLIPGECGILFRCYCCFEKNQLKILPPALMKNTEKCGKNDNTSQLSSRFPLISICRAEENFR